MRGRSGCEDAELTRKLADITGGRTEEVGGEAGVDHEAQTGVDAGDAGRESGSEWEGRVVQSGVSGACRQALRPRWRSGLIYGKRPDNLRISTRERLGSECGGQCGFPDDGGDTEGWTGTERGGDGETERTMTVETMTETLNVEMGEVRKLARWGNH